MSARRAVMGRVSLMCYGVRICVTGETLLMGGNDGDGPSASSAVEARRGPIVVRHLLAERSNRISGAYAVRRWVAPSNLQATKMSVFLVY
jgi:hypothetical protein